MMLIVTSLNMDWKLPVAYFLVPDGFPSQDRAELLRICLYKLNCTGAIVTNIVMDNCPLNYATFRKLGCKLTRNFQELDPSTDIKNNFGKHVLALFDPPHLSKLVRNVLGSWKTLIDWNNNKIEWQHIVNLYEYQKVHGFTLANKLTKQHVMFERNPMKVKFAVQVLSQSVANALLTMYEMKVQNFENVHATVDFLKNFDEIFDIMNSRHLKQKFGKAPLQEINENNWKSVFSKTVSYICNLKNTNGKSVLQSDRYASFLGKVVMNTFNSSNFNEYFNITCFLQNSQYIRLCCLSLHVLVPVIYNIGMSFTLFVFLKCIFVILLPVVIVHIFLPVNHSYVILLPVNVYA